MKIAVHGCYNSGNFGDNLMHDMISHYIRDEFGIATVCPWLKQRDNDRSVNGGKGWYDVCTADAAVFGGGGYFVDGGQKSRRYLLPAKIWKHLKTPYAIIGIGVGPSLTGAYADRVRIICEGASLITVRDSESGQLLAEVGVPEEKVEVTADIVIALTREQIPARAQRMASEDLNKRDDGVRYMGLHFPDLYGPRYFSTKRPFHSRRPAPLEVDLVTRLSKLLEKHKNVLPVWIGSGYSKSHRDAIVGLCNDRLPQSVFAIHFPKE